MGNDTKKLTFKPCISLLATSGKSLSYCVKYHEWISKCPNRCVFFDEGEIGILEDVEQKKYNIECLYFTRIGTVYHCTLFSQDNPFCESCQYAKIE